MTGAGRNHKDGRIRRNPPRGHTRITPPMVNQPHPLGPLEARVAPAAAKFNLADLIGPNGFKLSGAPGDAQFDSLDRLFDQSSAVSEAGDVNGDGFGDLIIGARGAAPNGTFSGAAYVIFGGTGLANVELLNLDGTNGFKINGVAAGDLAGFSVSTAGDVNGDGFADVIVGAPNQAANPAGFGASYVVFGKPS